MRGRAAPAAAETCEHDIAPSCAGVRLTMSAAAKAGRLRRLGDRTVAVCLCLSGTQSVGNPVLRLNFFDYVSSASLPMKTHPQPNRPSNVRTGRCV